MKELVAILVFISMGSLVFGQSEKDLKGPRFKNSKPWEQEKTSYLVSNKAPCQFKAYNSKNIEPWQVQENQNKELVAVGKKRPKGPKAKNIDPWQLPKR